MQNLTLKRPEAIAAGSCRSGARIGPPPRAPHREFVLQLSAMDSAATSVTLLWDVCAVRAGLSRSGEGFLNLRTAERIGLPGRALRVDTCASFLPAHPQNVRYT